MTAKDYRVREGDGAWWVEDGHGTTFHGPFDNQLVAHEWLAEFRAMCERLRATHQHGEHNA